MSIVYMAILALTLSIFSAVVYHYVSRSLRENMDALLRSKGEGIVHAINAYWASERVGVRKYGTAEKISPIEDAIDFTTIAQRWVVEKSKDPKLLDIIVQIFDTTGNAIASSKNTQGITPVSKETFRSVLDGKSVFSALDPSFPTKKGVRFRVFLTPAMQDEKVEYVVEIASPLSYIQTALNILRFTLFVLFPLTVLITGVMGAFLAKLALHPVDSMIKTIHNITAENMKLRLTIPGTKDEIQKLAETFNNMLQRLDIAFSTQKQLFEDLSHELKTPLTILKGEFEVVLKRLRSAQEYESIIKSSLEEINKITRLVENLLIIASFESQKIVPERKELDLSLLIRGVMNNFKILSNHKKIKMAIEEDESVAVLGDEKQLKQLFLNLLDNAIKYTPDGGRVDIRIRKKSPFAQVDIKDTGCGIREEEIAHIFDRYYRAEKTEGFHGFGLGLNIVKSIVDSHGGSVSVASNIGKGTTFTIYLPLSAV